MKSLYDLVGDRLSLLPHEADGFNAQSFYPDSNRTRWKNPRDRFANLWGRIPANVET
ncbi:hypothetical protein HC928_25030 [bacterium]|nr:hypothetical protein [bacterium]